MKKILFLSLFVSCIFLGNIYIDYKNRIEYPLETLYSISISRNTAKFEYVDDTEKKDIYKIISYNNVTTLANTLSVEGLHYVENRDTIDWKYRITFRYKLLENLYKEDLEISDTIVKLNREIVVLIGNDGILCDGKLYNDNQLYGEDNLTIYEMIMNSLDIYYNDESFGNVIKSEN